MILVLDDDPVVGGCVIRALEKQGFVGQMSNNVFDAMVIVNEEVPEMIFLDVFLTGPDGFTFLNEMASYADTMKVPVVVMSEKDFSAFDLSAYNVVGFLNKNTMTPAEIVNFAKLHITGEN